MDTINAYQRTAAIRSAIELDLFTVMADGPATAETMARERQASVRGIRILCDYLTVCGFLIKESNEYRLTLDSSLFLNRKSPAYGGGVVEFLLSDPLRKAFDQLTPAVRKGGEAFSAQGTVEADHPVWVAFAHCMGALMAPAARSLAEMLPLPADRPSRVLDVSASHGAWGLAFATHNPQSHLVALDWPHVLEVTRANAQKAGVADRFSTLAGSAFELDLGADYDVILAPNFLHHFNWQDCVSFLRKSHQALRPGGTIAIVEFVPNENRVSPPVAASFSLVMLATTPEGDAYTFAEYRQMLIEAGFQNAELRTLPASMNQVILARK